MIDVAKHIRYWRDGAVEDSETARILFDAGRNREALFFGHLALEKVLKGHMTRATGDVPPRTHDLARLAAGAGLEVDPEQLLVMKTANRYCLEGRYPESWPAPSPQEAKALLDRIRTVLSWLLDAL